jgi:hypothetical protein
MRAARFIIASIESREINRKFTRAVRHFTPTRENVMRSIFWSFAVAAAISTLASLPARADDAKKPEHKITQSESFIMIEPMYTTIVDEGLDIPDRDLRAEADHGMPVLRDDYVRSLMSFTAATVRPARQPDVAAIADRLQRVTDKALHRKGARVLLAQVAIQPKKQ